MAEDSTAHEERIGRILNEYLDLQAQGRPVSRRQILEQHPDLAEELADHLDMLEQFAPRAQPGLQEDMLPGFQILEELGRGGMGAVYKAYQQSTRRVVALKVMLDGPFASEAGKRRFELEVELAASLKHPNIIAIHDSGLDKGHYYLVMDYLDGKPLDRYVHRQSLTIPEKMRLMLTICRAVQYAHQKGVIHRDLKPSNILVDETGEPCVLDFGLARQHDPDRTRLSHTGQVLGTLPYMSPEQAEGDLKTIDTRTDIYSLGVIMYELFTGTAPYQTSGLSMSQALENIRLKEPARPSRILAKLNSEIDAIILRTLEKEPQRRYPSAGELAEDLQAWLDGRPVSARSHSSFYVIRKLAARHYFHTSVIFALLVTVVSFALGYFHLYQAERERAVNFAGMVEKQNKAIGVMEQTIERARMNDRMGMFGLFLSAWHAGHTERAITFREQIIRDTPEAFLADALLEGNSGSAGDEAYPGLSRLIQAEQTLKQGDLQRARDGYQAYIDGGEPELRYYAELCKEALDSLKERP